MSSCPYLEGSLKSGYRPCLYAINFRHTTWASWPRGVWPGRVAEAGGARGNRQAKVGELPKFFSENARHHGLNLRGLRHIMLLTRNTLDPAYTHLAWAYPPPTAKSGPPNCLPPSCLPGSALCPNANGGRRFAFPPYGLQPRRCCRKLRARRTLLVSGPG